MAVLPRGLPGLAVLTRLLALVLAVLCAPLALAGNVPGADGGGYQGADYWRDVRQGVPGQTQNLGVERGVLIDPSGEDWRQFRNQILKPYGAWALAGTVIALLAAFALIGKSKIKEGRSGNTIERWTRFDRYIHWLVAGLFIVLGLTGLCILYSRYFMIDFMGAAYGPFMQLSKWLHNYLGPLFVLCLAVMLIKWLKHNLINLVDLKWFARGGGLIGEGHPHAGFLNGGEKVWYWVLFLLGVVISVSGLVVDFPNFGQERPLMQDANLIHAGASLLLICGALAHMYMGSVTEGALEGMTSGQVDENWAKQHHDLWYEEATGKSAGHASAPAERSAKPPEPKPAG